MWEKAPTTALQVPFIINQPAALSPDKQAPHCSHIHMQPENCSSAVKVLHSRRDAEWCVNYKQACVALSIGYLLTHVLLIHELMESQRFAVNITPGICGQGASLYSAYANMYFPCLLTLHRDLLLEVKSRLTQWISSLSQGDKMPDNLLVLHYK